MLHILMQSIRLKMKFESSDQIDFPASVFVFDLQEPETIEAKFDFRDSCVYHTVYLRLGNKGILAAFDCGALDVEIGRLLRRESKYILHPIQFEELGAKFFYKASLFNRTPKFVVTKFDGEYQFFVMPIMGLSSVPVFNEWQHEEYGRVLSEFVGIPLEVIMPKAGEVMTWLAGEDNESPEVPFIDINKQPYRGVS